MQTSRVRSFAGPFVIILLSSWTAESAQPERKTSMPLKSSDSFSPEVHPDGKVTFRLRAPKAEKVSVVCEAVGTQPMGRGGRRRGLDGGE